MYDQNLIWILALILVWLISHKRAESNRENMNKQGKGSTDWVLQQVFICLCSITAGQFHSVRKKAAASITTAQTNSCPNGHVYKGTALVYCKYQESWINSDIFYNLKIKWISQLMLQCFQSFEFTTDNPISIPASECLRYCGHFLAECVNLCTDLIPESLKYIAFTQMKRQFPTTKQLECNAIELPFTMPLFDFQRVKLEPGHTANKQI